VNFDLLMQNSFESGQSGDCPRKRETVPDLLPWDGFFASAKGKLAAKGKRRNCSNKFRFRSPSLQARADRESRAGYFEIQNTPNASDCISHPNKPGISLAPFAAFFTQILRRIPMRNRTQYFAVLSLFLIVSVLLALAGCAALQTPGNATTQAALQAETIANTAGPIVAVAVPPPWGPIAGGALTLVGAALAGFLAWVHSGANSQDTIAAVAAGVNAGSNALLNPKGSPTPAPAPAVSSAPPSTASSSSAPAIVKVA
jgi:hypothetical protein